MMFVLVCTWNGMSCGKIQACEVILMKVIVVLNAM